MAKTIGIRELKSQTSAILRRAQRGESITITDRGRPIVQIVPVAVSRTSVETRLAAAIAAGRISWSGGKPLGDSRAARVRGRSVAEAVVEDRR